ncbi:MAG: PIG-L family deacetylase [Anaerolineales bacterium]|nr:PIG-L family deacetylase [Anaerolineales bacterium]
MNWVYLSPHLDDVVLSCGGLIWEQAQAGEAVSIWTVCAGDPPPEPFSAFAQSLHARWKTGGQAVERRRQEDIAACARLSATARHLAVPDCIYRYIVVEVENPGSEPGQAQQQFLYASDVALFGRLHPAEKRLVEELSLELSAALPSGAEVVSPLSLFGHVDHRLTRAAAECLGRPLWYYADYPYILKALGQIEYMRQTGWEETLFPISQAGLAAWQAAVAAYRSQISTFWPDLQAMYTGLEEYQRMFGGAILWKPSPISPNLRAFPKTP